VPAEVSSKMDKTIVSVIPGVKRSIRLEFGQVLSEEEVENAEHALGLVAPFVFRLIKSTVKRMRLLDPDESVQKEKFLAAIEAEYRAYALTEEAKLYLEHVGSEILDS